MFRNERIQCTILDPKLAFGCVLYHFVTSKMTGTNFARVIQCECTVLGELMENLSQQTRPMHLISLQTRVCVRFVPFCHLKNDRYEVCSGDAV